MKAKMLLGVALMLLGAVGVAMADTTTVAVSATVTGVCKFTTGGVMSFALDPATGGDVAASVTTQPAFWCTKNKAYTITDDNGIYESGTTYRVKHSSLNEYIPYTFTYTNTGTGLGKGTTIFLNIAGNVANNDYINAFEGSYSDTVTLTITP